MLRCLIFFFTLNVLLLPIAGYAGMSVSKATVSTTNSMSHANKKDLKCLMSMAKETCLNCEMENMNCTADCCCVDCVSHVVSLPAFFKDTISPRHPSKVVTVFKHFYLHITSPEQRPPLV